VVKRTFAIELYDDGIVVVQFDDKTYMVKPKNPMGVFVAMMSTMLIPMGGCKSVKDKEEWLKRVWIKKPLREE